jgi:NADH-quinone oxidoreductase subunit C
MLADSLKERPIAAALLERYPDAIQDGAVTRGETSLVVDSEQIAGIAAFLRHEQQFNRLTAVTAVDWHPSEPRFEIVYLFHSIPRNERLIVKCRLGEGQEMDSLTGVFKGANWYEREVFDLFGVVFRNHPDLTRIMLPDDWIGHPLRRDYPTHGHRYDYSEGE